MGAGVAAGKSHAIADVADPIRGQTAEPADCQSPGRSGRQAQQQLLATQLEPMQLQTRLTQSEGRPEGQLTVKAQPEEAGRQAGRGAAAG